MSQFIHLKVRSHYSILEGSMKISDIVSAAYKNKMPAIALTDNSNVFGAMEFTKACLEKSIQPIIGSLLYINPLLDKNNGAIENKEFEITLLVKDTQGWKNLSHLLSQAYYNFKNLQKKNITLKELCTYNEGLICLFNDIDDQDSVDLKIYKNNLWIFKPFNLPLRTDYILIYSGIIMLKQNTRSYLLEISNKLNIPLCCNNDIYHDKGIYEAHDCHCIAQGTTIDNPNRLKPNKESYFKFGNQMHNLFTDKPEAT